MLDEFSATIEKIYAAAADPALWEEALRAIEDYTGSTGAVLNLVPRRADAAPLCLAGSFSRDDCAEYATDYMWRCPRIAFGEQHPDIPIHYDHMILTESEMDRDATYEWYGKHGLRYYVAGWIGGTSDHGAYMSLQRSRRQGHVESDQVDQFALILKHMTQALSLAVKLGTLEDQCRFSLEMLDALPRAFFVLDPKGYVLLTNTRADHLLAQGDGLIAAGGKLECQLSSQQPLFDRLIKGAVATGRDLDEPKGGWIRIQRTSGRRPFNALVAPFRSAEEQFSTFQPQALLIVADPTDGLTADVEALRQLYALTSAEAKLACALSSGHSVESAAVLLGVQPATARSELKSVFRKVGVNRQQDLVRLLTSLSTISPPA